MSARRIKMEGEEGGGGRVVPWERKCKWKKKKVREEKIFRPHAPTDM